MTVEQRGESPGTEDLIGRALRAAGARPEIPAAMARQWEAALRTELQARNRQRRRRIAIGSLAAAACVASVALVAFLMQSPWQRVTSDALLATVVHVDGIGEADGGILVDVAYSFVAGARLRTGPEAFVGLRYRNADVRVRGDTELVFHRTRLELLRGAIYVDTGPTDAVVTSIIVETPLGSVSHVGTQFMVSVDDQSLSSAVREGALVLRTPWARRDLSARPGEAAIVYVTRTRKLDVSFEPLLDARWRWISAATSGLGVDGRSTADVLEWAARETGMHVVFADAATSDHARTAILHGNAVVRSLDDVLAVVGSSTQLAARPRDDGVIEVVLARSEADQNAD